MGRWEGGLTKGQRGDLWSVFDMFPTLIGMMFSWRYIWVYTMSKSIADSLLCINFTSLKLLKDYIVYESPYVL